MSQKVGRKKKRQDMNVGNGGPPLPLSAAHLQQLAQMGINPNQLNQLAMSQQLMAAQPQTNGLPQQLPPGAAAAAAAQQQAAVAAATAQQQQHLHQQQQHQQQAAAAAAAVAHGHPHTPHGGAAVSATPVVHIQPQQGAQIMAQLQQLQAAQHAHHAQAQQAQLAQQIQQAQMVNAVANPVCPPPPPGIPSMPWPVTSPVCHIPYFDMNMYRQVNIEVMPSHDQSGMDLPLTDIATLRFFFNFGVQQSRNLIAARSSQQQQQSHQQPQQQHLASFQEAIAAAAASGQNPANLISLMTNASAAQNQTASLEQLNALLGQHSMLRQAQQLQGNPAQAHLQQNAAMQQQLNSILSANQNNQRQLPQQAYVQQQQAIQQQLSVLMQQMPQNHQMAAAAAASAAAASTNERKITQSDLMAHAAAAQPPIGIAAQAQQLPVAQMQQAVTPVQQAVQQPSVPQQQPQATQAQTLQKHFDSHTLLLQHALLAASNNQAKQPSLHEIRLQAMAQQQATSSSTSPATGLHPFIRPTETLNNKQASSTTPTTGVLVSNSNGETTITISPRPPIPLDPSPPHVVVHVSKHELSAFLEKQVTEAQASSTTDEDAKPSTSTTVSTPTSVGAPTLSVSAATTSAAMPINPIGIANPMAVSSSALARTTVSTPANTTNSPASSLAAGTAAAAAGNVPPLIQISEDHFTDTFRKSEQKRQLGHLNPNAGQAGSPKTNGEPTIEEDGEDKPALAPILMMSYLNTCMSQAKTQLNANGVHVGVDDNGQIVDFTSRPIDPIFKDAREDLARSRDFQKRPHPTNTTPQPVSATATAIIGTNISMSSPNRQQYGESPKAEPMETGTMAAMPTLTGMNRSPASSTPKADSEEPIINIVGPEDDSEDDSVGGKRLRIATDED